MVLLGLSPASAIATAKFNGLGTSAGASSRFFKEKITDKRTVIIFSLLGAASALIGSLTLAHFSNHTEVLQKLMGLVILLIGVPLLYVRKLGLTTRKPRLRMKVLGLILMFAGVILQVALGSGTGSLQLIILIACFGMTALTASATRRAVQLTIAVVSLIIYMFVGLIDYQFGLVALVTSFAGGFIGAHIAIKRGNKFIINLFAAVSVLLALQLLLG